jgi:hypothetical protein
MSFMDSIKGQFENMDKDAMQSKYEELKSKEQAGDLDDKGKAMLEQLKTHLGKN